MQGSLLPHQVASQMASSELKRDMKWDAQHTRQSRAQLLFPGFHGQSTHSLVCRLSLAGHSQSVLHLPMLPRKSATTGPGLPWPIGHGLKHIRLPRSCPCRRDCPTTRCNSRVTAKESKTRYALTLPSASARKQCRHNPWDLGNYGPRKPDRHRNRPFGQASRTRDTSC